MIGPEDVYGLACEAVSKIIFQVGAEDREEVVQEAAARCLRKLDNVDPTRTPQEQREYVKQICRSSALMYLRHRRDLQHRLQVEVTKTGDLDALWQGHNAFGGGFLPFRVDTPEEVAIAREVDGQFNLALSCAIDRMTRSERAAIMSRVNGGACPVKGHGSGLEMARRARAKILKEAKEVGICVDRRDLVGLLAN